MWHFFFRRSIKSFNSDNDTTENSGQPYYLPLNSRASSFTLTPIEPVDNRCNSLSSATTVCSLWSDSSETVVDDEEVRMFYLSYELHVNMLGSTIAVFVVY